MEAVVINLLLLIKIEGQPIPTASDRAVLLSYMHTDNRIQKELKIALPASVEQAIDMHKLKSRGIQRSTQA